MKVTFYQIKWLFIDNSSYLGELIELNTSEVNVNLKNLSSIDLLLNEDYLEYNYIKVEKNADDYYYYILESQEYYNAQKIRFIYKIDILRTLKEKDLLNHNINISRYSELLTMSPKQQNYFWKNQDVKLGADVIENYFETEIKYSDVEETQAVWKNMKWLYLWLQPRKLQSEFIAGEQQTFQYAFTKQFKENVIEVDFESDLPLNKVIYKDAYTDMGYDDWPANQVYRVIETNKYYRVSSGWDLAGPPNELHSTKVWHYKEFLKLTDFEYSEQKYFLFDIPSVKIQDIPNSLYCLVLPLEEIIVSKRYADPVNLVSDKSYSWSADNIMPYLFDVESENNWNDFIVDAKISLVPPFEIGDPNLSLSRIDWSINSDLVGKPAIRNTKILANSLAQPISTLSNNLLMAANNSIKNSDIFLPFLTSKLSTPYKIKTDFMFPEITKENIIQKKFYLSVVEQRQEIDLATLKEANATTLYYYEDIFPGRTNVAFGFAPEDINYKTFYFLLHSPSTIFFDRDTSLPIFTSQYQSYISSNKNFIQQAQLQRTSELAQNLITSGSSAVGAGAVASSIPGYTPYAAYANAGGRAANAFINYAVQTKQFHWSVDNMKSAPGNYKAATATVSMMLSLGLFKMWIEQYKSSDFDIHIYDELIDDVGYEYFSFTYNLEHIMQNVFTGNKEKKYLQAQLTSFTENSLLPLPLINILKKQLEEGLNIYVTYSANIDDYTLNYGKE